MSKKDFFILAIKLFGLSSLVTSLFAVVPSSVYVLVEDFGLFGVIWVALVFSIIIGFFVLLVFRADNVVNSLKLDKGFDDDRILLGNFTSVDVVKIGTFLIGGLLFLDNFSAFLSHTLFAFRERVSLIDTGDTVDKFYWAVSAINLLVGYLLMTNYDFVARKFTRAEKERTGV